MSEALQQIEDCEARESQLSDWERSFISSIKSQLQRGDRQGTLTARQEEHLDKIWERVTSRN